jgi:hypothetical protein
MPLNPTNVITKQKQHAYFDTAFACLFIHHTPRPAKAYLQLSFASYHAAHECIQVAPILVAHEMCECRLCHLQHMVSLLCNLAVLPGPLSYLRMPKAIRCKCTIALIPWAPLLPRPLQQLKVTS